MQKPHFKTIFGRMLFLQWLAMFLVILLVGAVLTIVVHEQNIQGKRSLLLQKAQSISAVLQTVSWENVSQVRTAAAELDILITYIDETDAEHSVYGGAKWEELSTAEHNATRIESVRYSAGNVGDSMRRYFSDARFPILTVYRSVMTERGRSVLILHTDLSQEYVRMQEMILWTTVICLLAMLMSVIVSYYSAYRVVNPFVEISHTVQCYSRGDFSKRIPVKGKDEAAQLGRNFNEMAEQLKSLEDTRRSFVANVSHELRSPLTSMKGFLEAMQDGTIPRESYDETLSIVLNETRRMTTMVNDLLDLARIESGTITLHYEIFDINELIRRTLITFEARLSEQNMEMDVRFASEQCYVYADITQIGQVLRNLIDNAIKYSSGGKTVCVSTYSVRREVYVTVRDFGVGIPQEDVPRIFDRFYKVEKAHTPSPQIGSGLGLSIVKRIIEQHGQSITVRSARGRGTQFTFTLQRASMMKRVTDGGKRNGT